MEQDGFPGQILVNNRLQMGSFEEWGHQGVLKPEEDFYTPEQRIGAYDDTTPWETCMTIGTQWAWKPDDQIKSAAEVINDTIDPEETPRIMKAIPVAPPPAKASAKPSASPAGKNQNGPQPFSLQKQTQKGKKE